MEDTRFARRAARESDGLRGLDPGVALSESGNPGLSSGALSGHSTGFTTYRGSICALVEWEEELQTYQKFSLVPLWNRTPVTIRQSPTVHPPRYLGGYSFSRRALARRKEPDLRPALAV